MMDNNINPDMLAEYFQNLINRFFKILPMKENGEETLQTYIQSLQVELIGISGLISELSAIPYFIALLGTLQYFIDNPDCETSVVRREVFNSISACKHIADKFRGVR